MNALRNVIPMTGIAPAVVEPLSPYTARPSYNAAPRMASTLQDFRDAGDWIAVSTSDVEKIVAAFLELGEAVPESIARMDLHYWIDRGNVKPYRYYAKRWGWGEKRARNFWNLHRSDSPRPTSAPMSAPTSPIVPEIRGAKGAQRGRNEGAEACEASVKTNDQGATGAQPGRNRGAVYPDSENIYSTHTAREAVRKEGTGGTVDPNNPQHEPPALEAVVARGASMGAAPEQCEAFFRYYATQGWRKANGQPVTHWPLQLQSWIHDDAERHAERRTETATRPAVRTSATSTRTKVIAFADAWWLMDYHRAADMAAKEGVTDHFRRWTRLRGHDGLMWFVKPENLSRGLPDGFAIWEDAR